MFYFLILRYPKPHCLNRLNWNDLQIFIFLKKEIRFFPNFRISPGFYSQKYDDVA